MSKYDNLSKENLLKLVLKQEKELKNPNKYGLFWDKEKITEKVVTDCEHNLPILKRVKSKEIKTDNSDDNILIEGDNYHALQVLNYTHRGKIDVIYIDPPYNTGNKDFIYNDCYVDKEDGYRHSKWLNFMEKRLRLAKNLLSDAGVIFISIDDNEQANLKLLCDNIFGENNFITSLIINSAPAGTQSSTDFSIQHSYSLVYRKTKKFNTNYLEIDSDKFRKKYKFEDESGKYYIERLWKRGIGGKKEDVPTLHFPIYFDIKKEKLYIDDEIGSKDKQNIKKIIPYQTVGVLGRWTWSKKKMIEEKNCLKVVIVAGEYKLHKKVYNFTEKGVKPNSLIRANIGRTELGSLEVKNILGAKKFDYPKPLSLIKYFLKISTNEKSLVLDFMAGSGTTGHAVLELNKQDGGNRKFILCTNNENNICEEVTYPRVEKVINGYDFTGKDKTTLFEKKLTFSQLKNIDETLNKIDETIASINDEYDKTEKKLENNTIKIIGIKNIEDFKDGLGGNLQYFKTDFIKNTSNKDQLKINLTKKCTEMLCIKENIFNLDIKTDDFKFFISNDTKTHLCIYYNFLEKSFDDFVEQVSKLDGNKKVYIFALSNRIDKEKFKEIKNISFEAIPHKILEVYEQLVKLSKK